MKDNMLFITGRAVLGLWSSWLPKSIARSTALWSEWMEPFVLFLCLNMATDQAWYHDLLNESHIRHFSFGTNEYLSLF
jgi:hypothetical protein